MPEPLLANVICPKEPQPLSLTGLEPPAPEVEETLRWINTVEALEVPALLSTDTIDQIVSGLTQTSRTRSISDQKDHPDCLILADLENMEAGRVFWPLPH